MGEEEMAREQVDYISNGVVWLKRQNFAKNYVSLYLQINFINK